MLFVETTVFTRHLSTHLDDNGFAALQAFLSVHPNAGPIIRGSGGIRKLRYSKGVKQDLTAEETTAWRRVVEEIENG